MVHCTDITELERQAEEARAQAIQQTALVELSQRALIESRLQVFFEKTVASVSETLCCEFSKILELLPDGKNFLLRAGVGWKLGYVGHALVRADLNSQAGYTLFSSKPILLGDITTHEPVIVEDLRSEKRFTSPPLLRDHGIVSGMSVIIYGGERSFGVLGAHTSRPRIFTHSDARFLQSVANILAAAIRRDHTEQALLESERVARCQLAELESLYESAPVGRCLLDVDLHCLRINKWLADIAGHPPSEHIGHRLHETLPELANALAPIVQKAVSTGMGTRNLELNFNLSGDAAKRRCDWLVSLDALKENGHVVGINTVVVDITDRKHMEEELRASEARLRELADAMPQIVWIGRPDRGDVEYANKKWFEYSGFSEQETYSPDIWNKIIHPEDVAQAERVLAEALQTGQPFQKEVRLKQRNHDYRWHLTRALPARDGSGRIVRWFGTCTDIEDQKRVERDLQSTQEKLALHARELESCVDERTAKLKETIESLQRVLYHIAHDLRAPLRAMAGFAQLLAEDLGPHLNAETKDCASRLIAASKRMDKLILDLLAFGRLGHQSLSLGPVNLEKAIDLLLLSMADEIKLRQAELQVARPMPVVRANPDILNQVLIQVLRNALTFVAPDRTPKVRFWTEQREGTVRLWIEDNGIGFDPAYKDKVFQVFERLHGAEEYPGTGIGLAIVAKGMERMGGSAGVESTPGKGSRFWLELQSEPKTINNQ